MSELPQIELSEPPQSDPPTEDPPTDLVPQTDQAPLTLPQLEPSPADPTATSAPSHQTPPPSNPIEPAEAPSPKKQQQQAKRTDNHSVELQVDWFNFETRMRKVIFEVVDPMTRKQFLTFEGLEEMKKQMQMMEGKNQEIKDRVERNIKKCGVLDIHEKRIKELENEMVMVKGIARNENASVLEKIETISQRVKITQQEVNTLSRFDEKIKKVQQQVLQVTDEYNATVTNRLKEVSAGFIKQVNDLDGKHREHHRELQEVLLKLDTLKDFTQRHDLRFNSLQTFVNDLRETFEDTRLMMAAGKIEGANETIEGKLRAQIAQLEKQLGDFQKLQSEQDAELRKGLHSLTSNRLDQFIFQSQQEMFEKIFSVKNINLHGHHGSHKRSKGVSMTDFQLQIQSNYRQWREIQLARGRMDRVNILMDDLSHLRKQSVMQSSSLRDRSESQHSGGVDSLQAPIMEEASEEDLLKRQTEALLGPSLLRKSIIDPENEEQRRQLMNLQLIDQQAMIVGGSKDINNLTINVNSETKQEGVLTPVQERKISDAKSISDEKVSPQVEYEEEEQSNKKSRRANHRGSQDHEDSSYLSSSASEDSHHRSKKVRLPPFLADLSEERLKTLIEVQTTHLLERLSDQETLTQQKLDSLEARLSHNPLLNMISKNRELIEQMAVDLTKLKDDGNRVQMSQDIRRLDATLNLTKNDLYQQIYKMREFQDQLYLKGVEQDARMDQEGVKTKKRADEMQSSLDGLVAELKRTQREIADARELIGAVGEAVCSIVELEAVASALEQQDEVDRKGWVGGIQQANNNSEDEKVSGYNPSPVNFLGQPFKRQNLVYCRRVLIEGLILQQISVKEPFSSFIKQKLSVPQDAFRNRLVSKLTKIDSEFQQKLDQLAAELERQHRLANPVIPKEVQRIKEVLKINDDQQTKNLAKPTVSRNASNVLRNRTGILPENVILMQNQNGHKDHHQKLRLALNQSMIETSTNSLAMNQTHDEIQKLDSKFRRHDALKPLPNNPLDKLGMSVNVGNIEYLPRQMQPIRAPHMLLNKSSSQVPQGNRHVQLPHPPDSPGSKIPSTIYNSPSNHRQLGDYQPNYRAIEMRQADIILNQSHVIPTLQNVVSSAIRLSQMSDREDAAVQRSSAGSKQLMIK